MQLHPHGVCEHRVPCSQQAAPPRGWCEVPKPVGLCSDAKICVECAARCTFPSSPPIPLQINSLPPESSLLLEEAAPDGVLFFFFSYFFFLIFFPPSCQQPGLAQLLSRQEQERSGLSRPQMLPGMTLPCSGTPPPGCASINRFDD